MGRATSTANRAYARTLLELGGADAEIWVQDFHLMLVARELRARAATAAALGFYLHVPFPPLDMFETMPWAAEMIAALLELRSASACRRSAGPTTSSRRARGLLGADGRARAQ